MVASSTVSRKHSALVDKTGAVLLGVIRLLYVEVAEVKLRVRISVDSRKGY
jgi:hypothetical protein